MKKANQKTVGAFSYLNTSKKLSSLEPAQKKKNDAKRFKMRAPVDQLV